MSFDMTEAFEPENISDQDVIPEEAEYTALTEFLADIAKEELQDPNHESDPENYPNPYVTDPEIIFDVAARMATYSFTAGRAYQNQFTSPTDSDELTVTITKSSLQGYLDFLQSKIEELEQ